MRQEDLQLYTRRHFFRQSGFGIGPLALYSLLNERLFGAASDPTMLPKAPHFAPKAKRIVFLFMAGAPSQLDLLDYKPALNRYDGQPVPEDVIKGERFAFIKGTPKLLGSPHSFTRHGQSGAELSSLLPHLANVVDDIAIVRSCWGSGFLPTIYQGVQFRSSGDPVLFLSNPDGVAAETRRRSLDLLRDLNQSHQGDVGDPEIATRIASYEMAYRMQSSVPELTDLAKEPPSVHEMYGTEPGKASFGNNCLLARRLLERGVRFVQLYHRGWDTHGSSNNEDIVNKLGMLCRETDRPAAALIKDLKQRGLLDSTLVVWGGEFGRTPMNEARGGSKFLGRDHHPRAFSMWLAGGGIKPGVTVGRTDDIGYNVAEEPVSVHDLHATILRLMGLEHTRLTYKSQGRDFRLTDVSGEIVNKLLA